MYALRLVSQDGYFLRREGRGGEGGNEASLTWSQHSRLSNGSFLQDAIDKDVACSVLDGTADSLHRVLDQSHSFDTCERAAIHLQLYLRTTFLKYHRRAVVW